MVGFTAMVRQYRMMCMGAIYEWLLVGMKILDDC